MAITEAQKKATAKYVKKNYDRIEFKVIKGKKEIIQQYAEKSDGSINAFMNRIVNEAMGIEADQHEAEE